MATTTQQMMIPFSIKSLIFTSQDKLPSHMSATQHDGLPFWACPIASQGHGREVGDDPHTNKSYITRLYHQDMREVVIDVNPPAFQTFMGLCWWSILEEYPFFIKYQG
ncbi:hypothetical protein L208DRAFT_1422391 [Tricholoma matsutake]|nr:hypothetical protein L208DRAFT_1422391 [Tricholoma matsutake 945]